MNNLDELISGTPIYKFLDENSINKIRICRYVSGARVRFSDCILFLAEGTVSYSYGDQSGNPYHVIFSKAFNLIGELVYYHNLRIFDIFAHENSVILEFPLTLIKDLEENPDFNIYILKQTNKNLMDLVDKMMKRNLYKLENYLAYIIVSDQINKKYYYKSMTSLASVFNVSRRNLYYAADSLVERGLIKKGSGHFLILNESALKGMI